MSFNEDSRVKIPTLLHLTRLGYRYASLKELEWDKETNTSRPIFYESLKRLNPEVNKSQLESYYKDLTLLLDNEDLEKEFYAKRDVQKTVNNLQQNNEIASLRDWLLPMLMNGQVKVTSAKDSATKLGEVKASKSLSSADKDFEGLDRGKEYVQDGDVGIAAEEGANYKSAPTNQ